MKNLYKLMLALALTGQLTSCDYLDIVPDERAQESDTWKTPNSIKGYLYSCLVTDICLCLANTPALTGCRKK